jgi:hypothetical protein
VPIKVPVNIAIRADRRVKANINVTNNGNNEKYSHTPRFIENSTPKD